MASEPRGGAAPDKPNPWTTTNVPGKAVFVEPRGGAATPPEARRCICGLIDFDFPSDHSSACLEGQVETLAAALAALVARAAVAEQTERQAREDERHWRIEASYAEAARTDALDAAERAEAKTQRLEVALKDACDVAIWLSGLEITGEAWTAWETKMRPKLFAALDALRGGCTPESEPAP